MEQNGHNYIRFRDDRKDFPVDTENFTAYYTRGFESDLRKFFDIVNDFGDRTYPFVREMPSGVTNLQRRYMVWDDLNHYYMFSVAVFYMSMCTQIIGRLYGWNQMENFMRASQWPMLCCGMGGLMHPIQVMRESDLCPQTSDDSYIQTLLNAGKYLKTDFLEFMQRGVSCLNRTAHNSLVAVVDANALSELFDRQEQLYCDWIRNHKTEYESNYVPYPVEGMEKALMHDYLMEFREEVPQWLREYKPGDQVDFSEFMSCRVGYYPGAGFDGNLIKVGNRSHSVHCFMHADYGILKEEMEKHLAKGECIAGYHSIGRVDWSDKIHVGGHEGFREGQDPYCFMEVFERNPDKDNSWGASRFAVVFIYADAIETYKELFVNRYNKAPWIFLLQDHGFGGNYDMFGRGGALDSIIRRGVKPKFVICAENTRVWGGYYRMDSVLPTCGGMHRDTRHLYAWV